MNSNKYPKQLIIAAICISSLPSSYAAGTGPTSPGKGTNSVATVNGVNIPESRYEFALKQNAFRNGNTYTSDMKKQIRETLIDQEIVAQAAEKKGLDKTQDFKTMMDLSREQDLVNVYLSNYKLSHPVTDAEMKQEYDAIKSKMGSNEYQIRDILVKTESEAKDIIAQLKKGANFSKLAATKSIDSYSKNKGGELGWSPASNYSRSFGDAIRMLKKGEISPAPIQTKFGWHVIQLEDERPLKLPPFDQVKPQLKQRVQQEQIQKLISSLRATAKIKQ